MCKSFAWDEPHALKRCYFLVFSGVYIARMGVVETNKVLHVMLSLTCTFVVNLLVFKPQLTQ